MCRDPVALLLVVQVEQLRPNRPTDERAGAEATATARGLLLAALNLVTAGAALAATSTLLQNPPACIRKASDWVRSSIADLGRPTQPPRKPLSNWSTPCQLLGRGTDMELLPRSQLHLEHGTLHFLDAVAEVTLRRAVQPVAGRGAEVELKSGPLQPLPLTGGRSSLADGTEGVPKQGAAATSVRSTRSGHHGRRRHGHRSHSSSNGLSQNGYGYYIYIYNIMRNPRTSHEILESHWKS